MQYNPAKLVSLSKNLFQLTVDPDELKKRLGEHKFHQI